MKQTPITTVIGSYPVEVNTKQVMTHYFQQQETSWKPYITQAVTAMVEAGIHMISDGQTRDSFTTIFLRHINGIRIRDRPEVIDHIAFNHPIVLDDYTFVKHLVPKKTQLIGTLAGPFTLMKTCIDHVYNDEKDLAFAFAAVMHEEARHLSSVVDMISVDEPFFSMEMPDYAKELFSTVVKGIDKPLRLHVCGDVSQVIPTLVDMPVDVLSHEFKATPKLFKGFSEHPSKKNICLGSVRSDNQRIEAVDEICKHIRKAQDVFGDHIVQLSPDCGQRMLSPTVAFQKLQNLVQAWRQMYGG